MKRYSQAALCPAVVTSTGPGCGPFQLRCTCSVTSVSVTTHHGIGTVRTQRVTREQLEEKITPELLHHIEVLERAMEINKAIWNERYPRRVLERRSKQAAENAARARRKI